MQLARLDSKRQRLSDSKRMTPEKGAALDRIQSALTSLRGSIAALDAAQTDDARKAIGASLDERLAEVERMFSELGN